MCTSIPNISSLHCSNTTSFNVVLVKYWSFYLKYLTFILAHLWPLGQLRYYYYVNQRPFIHLLTWACFVTKTQNDFTFGTYTPLGKPLGIFIYLGHCDLIYGPKFSFPLLTMEMAYLTIYVINWYMVSTIEAVHWNITAMT